MYIKLNGVEMQCKHTSCEGEGVICILECYIPDGEVNYRYGQYDRWWDGLVKNIDGIPYLVER